MAEPVKFIRGGFYFVGFLFGFVGGREGGIGVGL